MKTNNMKTLALVLLALNSLQAFSASSSASLTIRAEVRVVVWVKDGKTYTNDCPLNVKVPCLLSSNSGYTVNESKNTKTITAE